MSLYKVKEPMSGLFWKGGGMNKNNQSSPYIFKKVDGKYTHVKLDKNSEEHALMICFSKTGKTWNSLRAAKRALGFGHEPGLNSLLKKCELIEIQIVEVKTVKI